jgi:hypothetical protein
LNLDNITSYALNLKGWHTSKKIIVIHSDDWGSIRMPSNKAREKLQSHQEIKESNAYAKYDTLASTSDLEALFEVLHSVKDKNNNPAVLTANCLMANPNFDKIRNDNFEVYHYEHLTETFARYDNEKALILWKEGLNTGVFIPQYHGREHVNFSFWLQTLRENHSGVKMAFDYETFGLNFKRLTQGQINLQRAWDILLPNVESQINKSIVDGLNLFKAYFGFSSLSAIAPNYTWSKDHEALLKDNGVISMQGILNQRITKDDKQPYAYKKRYTDISDSHGMSYQRRNVFFEPSHYSSNDVIDKALRRINISFKMRKPAIIGTHRVNFVGTLNVKNRDKNILLFKKLLSKITQIWPDVIFMSAAELAKTMKND